MKKLSMSNIRIATQEKCCVCGRKASVFWPMIDPDIPAHPYCRECLEKEKIKVMEDLRKIWGEGK